jgi:alpha-maltose-1-phosphate synthase
MPSRNAAIMFEPDGYLPSGPVLMGRQSAGNGFLRAIVAASRSQALSGYTPSPQSAQAFRDAVAAIDPAVETAWIPGPRLDLLAQAEVLYRPDQTLGPMARQRLRLGPAAYSLCGVTHTLSTHTTLDAIAKILVEPVMPWDALVCTSNVARSVVSAVLDHQADYLRWRNGHPPMGERPLLPVIPLGVHADDFAFTDADRRAARDSLGLAEDEVAALFAGRLSISGKTHPYAMFAALQQTAQETGRPLALLLAGQAFNDGMAKLFLSGLKDVCPDVRAILVDGKDAAAYRAAWAGADLFISLADSVQETFGITPLEAMAAGLPALVSDWNGYKDTVRDGVDGFRIPTWAPPPGAGQSIAAAFEAGSLSYEQYLSRSNTAVAVDMGQLVQRLTELVVDPDLRRRLGEAGRKRARETFDWAVVFRSYQALWAEQIRIRRKTADDATASQWVAKAPRSGADHMGPFETFASYPTHHLGPTTLVAATPGATGGTYRNLIAQEAVALWTMPPDVADSLLAALTTGPLILEDLAAAIGVGALQTTELVARLAKLGLLSLSDV